MSTDSPCDAAVVHHRVGWRGHTAYYWRCDRTDQHDNESHRWMLDRDAMERKRRTSANS